MDFHFLDSSKISITNYSFYDFDGIIKKFGYKEEKNIELHKYFEWNNIEHWSFKYEHFSKEAISKMFKNSIKNDSPFLIRIKPTLPLIQVAVIEFSEILDDLIHENGVMGWQAISTDGKYIIEFTDDYEHLAKSNFRILG